jgi:ATP-dependent Clp protease ATP-binding subunit ClpC
MSERGLELIMNDEAKEFLITRGYNPDYGARPLRRAIENLIENPLAEELLRGSFQGKDRVYVEVEGDEDNRKFKFIPVSKGEPALVGAGAGSESAAGDGKNA